MSNTHSLLSPGNASRWMECTPSAVFESSFKKSESHYADEGTLAHKLSELMVNNYFNLMPKVLYKHEVGLIKKHKFYTQEMLEHCNDLLLLISDMYADMTAEVIHVELKLDLTKFIPEGSGRVDFALISPTKVSIIDLKYGKGIRVDAKENKQQMLYALGILELYPKVEEVEINIYQPRLNHHDVYITSRADLETWAVDTLAPKVEKAYKGLGAYTPGDHCKFCRARNSCKALYEHNTSLAAYHFADANKLTDQDIADILGKSSLFKNWISGIEEYALNEALTNGKKWPGFKLVEGRSNRALINQEAIKKTFELAKIDNDLYLSAPELLGITALTKNLGQELLYQLIGENIEKKPGKPALVPVDDKRTEYDKNEIAAKIFKDL